MIRSWPTALGGYWCGGAFLYALFLSHLPDAVIPAVGCFARYWFAAVFAWMWLFDRSPHVCRMLLFVLLFGFACVIAVGTIDFVGEEHLVASAAVFPKERWHRKTLLVSLVDCLFPAYSATLCADRHLLGLWLV